MNQRQREFIAAFAALGDWFTRFAYLMELAGAAEPMPPALKTEENRLKSCQSRSWAHISWENGRAHMLVESEALVSKGVLAVFPLIVNGASASELLETPLTFLEDTGLDSQLESDRLRGLGAVIKALEASAAERAGL